VTFPQQDWQYPQAPSPYAPGHVANPDQPTAMRRAVALMYAGAAISFVSTVVAGVGAFNEFKSPEMFYVPGAPVLAFVIFVGLVPCGLWLWMAWKNGAGREWARVLSTVFFGLMSLQLVPTVLVRLLVRPAGVTGIVGIAEWLVGCVALLLLYRRESSQFFTRARYARAMRQYPPPGYGQQPPYGRPPQ
jgi:FtsH-binding integral membrane protein